MEWTLDELLDVLIALRNQYGNVPVRIAEQCSDWELPKNWIYPFDVDAAMSDGYDNSHYEIIIH